MRIKGYRIVFIFLLFVSGMVYSRENRTEISVDFRVNSTVLDPNYGNNAAQLSEISSFIKKIKQDTTIRIVKVLFGGSASPECSYQLNKRLATGRLEILEDLVRNEIEIADSVIIRDDNYISWEYLVSKVKESDLKQKQAVLDILAQEPSFVDYSGGGHIDHRIVQLQKMNYGRVWRQLYSLYFGSMRSAYVVFVTSKIDKVKPLDVVVKPVEVEESKSKRKSIVVFDARKPVGIIGGWTRKLYIKTNALGLGMAISNVGVEVDLVKHLSFAVPVYYSAWNYFLSTIKFRTLAVQPELRYWFNQNNQKFFIGAHFGYAQYNVAVEGDYRYQDHGGKSPALGGGISLGYRMPISDDNKWHIEFTLGAGAYGLHYDKYYNVNNGKLIDTHRKIYWGVDNAAINISYNLDLKKRKK